MKEIYNEGRVIGLSSYELFVRQLLNENPNADVPSERQWLGSVIANGAAMVLKIPSGTSAGYHDYALPSNSLLRAGNGLIALPFYGTADFSGNWAVRITSYGKLIANNSSSSPVTPGGSSNVPANNPTISLDSSQLAEYRNYDRIREGLCFQPGTWNNYGQHGVKKELVPNFSKPPIIRIYLSKATDSDVLIFLHGFTNSIILQGSTGYDNIMDTDAPQDGDFLGPEAFPWATKISFIDTNEILQFKEDYKLTHTAGGQVKTESILDINTGTYYDSKFTDSKKSDTVSDISASPNGVGLLGLYDYTQSKTPPALYASKVLSTGQISLVPVDTVAPGTLKMYKSTQLAVDYTTLIKNTFGLYVDSDNILSVYDNGTPIKIAGAKVSVTSSKPYVAKVEAGDRFIKTISLTDSVSGNDLNINGTAGSDSVEEITWAVLLNMLDLNKKITIAKAERADKATKDGDGNTITSSYGASLSVSGNNLSLVSKDGTVLDTESLPDSGVTNVATGSTNGTISVTKAGQTSDVAVKGLQSAAYRTQGTFVERIGYEYLPDTKCPTVYVYRYNEQGQEIRDNNNYVPFDEASFTIYNNRISMTPTQSFVPVTDDSGSNFVPGIKPNEPGGGTKQRGVTHDAYYVRMGNIITLTFFLWIDHPGSDIHGPTRFPILSGGAVPTIAPGCCSLGTCASSAGNTPSIDFIALPSCIGVANEVEHVEYEGVWYSGKNTIWIQPGTMPIPTKTKTWVYISSTITYFTDSPM